MKISTDLLKVLILLVDGLVTQMNCSQKFESIVRVSKPYNTSRELYPSKSIFGDANLLSFVHHMSKMALRAQQETLHINAIKDKDILLRNISLHNIDYCNNAYSKCSINSSYNLDEKNTYNNFSLNSSSNLFNKQTYSNCLINSSCNIDSNDTYSNYSVNSSGIEIHQRAPTFQQPALTKVIVLLLITLLSLVGNIAIISFILKTDRHSTSTLHTLLLHLSMADLLVSLFCILVDTLWTLSVAWYGGNFLCKSVKFMQMFSLYASTNMLVLIGFDRMSAVRFPMTRVRAKHRVQMGLVCVWTISALFSLPQVSS